MSGNQDGRRTMLSGRFEKIYDISLTLGQDSGTFPGDREFRREMILSLDQGEVADHHLLGGFFQVLDRPLRNGPRLFRRDGGCCGREPLHRTAVKSRGRDAGGGRDCQRLPHKSLIRRAFRGRAHQNVWTGLPRPGRPGLRGLSERTEPAGRNASDA